MTNQEPLVPRESGLASGWTVQPEPLVDTSEPEAETPASENTVDGLSSVTLMLLGVFGGLYLLYTWGWFEIARAYAALNSVAAGASGLIGGILQQIVFWIAPLAPLAWFLTSYSLTKRAKRSTLALTFALLGGAIILLPLPIIFGGSGQ